MLKNVAVTQLAEAGLKRISVGGVLSRAGRPAMLRAGIEMRDQTSFGWTSELACCTDVNKLFGTK